MSIFVFGKQKHCQNIEKVVFDKRDSTNDYYLATRPASNYIKGTLVVFCSFRTPESLLPETKLHNVAFANDLLTVYISMGRKLYADTATVD